MKLVFRETDGVTGDRLTLGDGAIPDGSLLTRSGRRIIGTLAGIAHNPVTVIDGDAIDLTIGGASLQELTADLLYDNNYFAINGSNQLTAAGTLLTHDLLSVTHHGDTIPAAVVRGDIITGQGAAPNTFWTRLAIGSSGNYLRSDGTDTAWSAFQAGDLPNLGTAGKLAKFGVTGLADSLLTETVGGIEITTGKYFGLGSAGGRITFTDNIATDFVTINDCYFGVGIATPLAKVHVAGNGALESTIIQDRASNDAYAAYNRVYKSRGTITARVNVNNGDTLGGWQMWGYYGGAFYQGAQMSADIDGTPSATSMPGRIMFYTTPVGATSPIEAGRITCEKHLQMLGDIRAQSDTYGFVAGAAQDFRLLYDGTNTVLRTLVGAANYIFDGYTTVDTDATVKIVGGEAKDAIFDLVCDEGDDAADKYRLRTVYNATSANNVLKIQCDNAVKDTFADLVTLTSAGYFGLGTTPSYLFHAVLNQNDITVGLIENTTDGTTAYSSVGCRGYGSNLMTLCAISPSYTTDSRTYWQDKGVLFSGNNVGMVIEQSRIFPIDLYTNSVHRVTVTGAGLVGVATTAPLGQLDICYAGTESIMTLSLGADHEASTRTNNTNKYFIVGMSHYASDTEGQRCIIKGSDDETNAFMRIGFSESHNGFTNIQIGVAPNSTSAHGYECIECTSTMIRLNGDHIDMDFCWEADANVNGLYCDAGLRSGLGSVGVGVAPATGGALEDPVLTVFGATDSIELIDIVTGDIDATPSYLWKCRRKGHSETYYIPMYYDSD